MISRIGPRKATVIALAATIAALLVGAVLGLLNANNVSREELADRFESRAEATATLVRATVQSSLPQVSRSLPRSLSVEDFRETYPNADAALVALDGSVVARTTRGTPPLSGSRLGEARHVRRALDADEVGLSDLIETGSGDRALEVAFPAVIDGDTPQAGALVFQFPPAIPAFLFGDVLAQLSQQDTAGGEFTLLDSNGRVIAGNAGTDLPAQLLDSRAPNSGTVGGLQYRIASIPGTPWMLLATVNEALLFSPIGEDQWVFFLLLAALAVFGGLALVMVVRALRTSEDLAEANLSLAERNREVEEANRAKDRFLASMSHELRTPLTAIIGFTQLVHDGRVEDPEARKECLGDVLSSSEHLLDLINEALDVSAAESGRLKIAAESFDPGELVREAAESMVPIAEEREVDLDLSEVRRTGPVRSDPKRVRQVALNYVSNALKFTPPGGRVRVRTRREPTGHLFIEVEDTGVGIPVDQQDRLFHDFEQIGPPVCAESPGSGLGLSVTRRIVEAMGGTVGFHSTEGVGSSFWARLPDLATEASDLPIEREDRVHA